MVARMIQSLTSTQMLVFAGFFLLASLLALFGILRLPVDPAWVTILIAGTPLLHAAIIGLFVRKSITSSLLISLAMAASIAIGEVFAAAEIAFIMAIGEMLEEKTVAKARRGIEKLISLTPQRGRRLHAEAEEIVAVEQIRRGDLLRVLPGESIPVDGIIRVGNTSIDQSVMTGESLPVDRGVGDAVYSGSINRFGAIDIEATRVGADSSLQKLIRMVREAEDSKAPMQRTVDVWASWLVPAALVIALLTYFITGELIRAVTVLVVFCPCALALATPTSIMAAIGQATRYGVLIKSGEALEQMGKVDRIAFDKTGTLTHGALQVSDCVAFSPVWSDTALLRVAASVESRSEHPLGKAIVAQARQEAVSLAPVEDFAMLPGKGVSAVVEGRPVLCGNSLWLGEHGVVLDDRARAALEQLRLQGKATLLVAVDGLCVGLIALADSLRQGATVMVRELRYLGAEAILLTGDHRQTATYFAGQAEIEAVFAELLPAAKVEHIRALQAQGHVVCMIGDGVNDAPALKTADVGVAMGGMGSDIALEAADIALMGDDMDRIPYLKRLSNVTIKSIKFNITLGMLINLIAVGLSVFGLLTPVSGALVHNAGSVLVVLNAARLYERKLI